MLSTVNFVLFTTSIVQVLSPEPPDCECGKPSDAIVSMRIVGGRRVEPHSYPWIVAILKNRNVHCGGSVITTEHIISAGHCFKWDNVEKMEVLLGLDDLDNRESVESRSITKVVIHENFTSTSTRDENDIAIVTLDRPVKYNDKIRPICLPEPGQDFSAWVGTIAGWGRTGTYNSASKVLLKASLKILNDEDCMHSKLAPYLKPTMMCALSDGKDGCQGDSGGPFVVFEPEGRYILAGIVSWGIGCAHPNYPGVYTNVSYYVDWIRRKIADGITCAN